MKANYAVRAQVVAGTWQGPERRIDTRPVNLTQELIWRAAGGPGLASPTKRSSELNIDSSGRYLPLAGSLPLQTKGGTHV